MSNSGWNRPAANQPVKKGGVKYPPSGASFAKQSGYRGAPSAMRGIVAGLVVTFALGGLCLWMFCGGDAAPKAKSDRERGRIKEVRPAPAKASREPIKKVARPKTVEEAMSNIGELAEPKIEKKRVVTPEEMYRMTNRIFRTGTEQLLGWACCVTPGDAPIPIPPLPEVEKKNLVGILISDIEIKDSDSERVAELKERVAYAKKQLMKYLAEGGDPDEFLQHNFKELRAASEFRMAVVSQAREIFAEGDKELARDFCKKANEKLEEQGIKTVKPFDYGDMDDVEPKIEQSNEGERE